MAGKTGAGRIYRVGKGVKPITPIGPLAQDTQGKAGRIPVIYQQRKSGTHKARFRFYVADEANPLPFFIQRSSIIVQR